MKQMKEMSFKDRDAIFGRLEKLASRANMSKEERLEYRESWKINNDYFNSVDYAKKEGRAEGRAEGLVEGENKAKTEMARNLKAMGMNTDAIAQVTGLAKEVIEAL